MTLIITDVLSNKDEQTIEIEWGYVSTTNGRAYVRFVTTENYNRGKYDHEEIEIKNDSMMVNILP